VLTEFFEKIKDEKYFRPFCITAQFARAVVNTENKDEFWLMYVDQFPAGYGFVRGWFDNWTDKVLGVVVEPEERNKGYGEMLCRLLEFVTKQRGISKLRLHVNKENIIAYKMYEKLGYRESGTQENGEIIMVKEL
jgi:ribosomal protein S18 acetylase RimI-like enzyme